VSSKSLPKKDLENTIECMTFNSFNEGSLKNKVGKSNLDFIM